uniref:Uncharacterized protein n=1 Tax=Oryza sativa subsp. japonica TaxID=39947 RepID=Q6H4F9_ORYSJ|nr:hypothetical protein [Oryza sativa Japonica Group]
MSDCSFTWRQQSGGVAARLRLGAASAWRGGGVVRRRRGGTAVACRGGVVASCRRGGVAQRAWRGPASSTLPQQMLFVFIVISLVSMSSGTCTFFTCSLK